MNIRHDVEKGGMCLVKVLIAKVRKENFTGGLPLLPLKSQAMHKISQ